MKSVTPIRVMVVDDHAMVRRGLATFLSVFDDLEFVGEAESGENAIELCRSIHPDVVIMDMVMPDMDGVTATRIIRTQFPSVQVIGLTSFKEDGLVLNALTAGAIGYLLKDVSAEELAKAIRSAYAGRSTISTEAAQALVQAANNHSSSGHTLTDRECEVLSLMVDGKNNTEIAKSLVVSPSTVKSHVSNILSKLGVSNRTEAVALAIRQKLIKK
jgi:two-component system, NarL family, response regulator LiaR